MKTTCEAMIHAVVVSPVVLLARLIEMLVCLAGRVHTGVDRLSGDTRMRHSGADDCRPA